MLKIIFYIAYMSSHILEAAPFINKIVHYLLEKKNAKLHILFFKANQKFSSAAPIRSSAG